MGMTVVTISADADPTGAYKCTREEAEEACGLIPFFWMNTMLDNPEDAKAVMDGMLREYTFGGLTSAFDECTITEEGVYQANNDEDPDLAPYMRLLAEKEVEDGTEILAECFIYPYGLVAVRDADTTTITRMD